MFRTRISKLSLAFLLALAMTVVPLPWAGDDEAGAMTRCGTEFTYYSDASLTQVVGMQTWTPTSCGCQLYSWGSITPFRTLADSYC